LRGFEGSVTDDARASEELTGQKMAPVRWRKGTTVLSKASYWPVETSGEEGEGPHGTLRSERARGTGILFCYVSGEGERGGTAVAGVRH